MQQATDMGSSTWVEETSTHTLRRPKWVEGVFHGTTLAMAIGVLALLGGIILSLFIGAAPAFARFGFGFLTREVWNPVTEQFGAVAPIAGTIITSIIAMLFGVPIGFGIALFITELCPTWLKRPLGIAIELLAGIPSIIYGIWGLFVFAPFMQQTIQPLLIATLGEVPGIGRLFSGPPYGIGVLHRRHHPRRDGAAVHHVDHPRRVRNGAAMVKEFGLRLGATTWEVVWKVVLPYTRVGVVGGVMLGLGRALGETMAVTFVIGNAHRIAASILAPGTTISATIANEFTEATGDLYTSSLIALGLILFFITFIVLTLARLMLAQMQKSAGT